MQGDSPIAAIFKMLNESFKMFFFCQRSKHKREGESWGGGREKLHHTLKNYNNDLVGTVLTSLPITVRTSLLRHTLENYNKDLVGAVLTSLPMTVILLCGWYRRN